MPYGSYYPSLLSAGLLAGLRSLSAPAAAIAALGREAGFPAVAVPALRALATGEMLIDKLPMMPDRTSPVPLAGRAAMGMLAGLVVAAAYKRSLLAGALLAGGVAIAASYAGLAVRRVATSRLGLPDTLVALVEDVVVVGLGRTLR